MTSAGNNKWHKICTNKIVQIMHAGIIMLTIDTVKLIIATVKRDIEAHWCSLAHDENREQLFLEYWQIFSNPAYFPHSSAHSNTENLLLSPTDFIDQNFTRQEIEHIGALIRYLITHALLEKCTDYFTTQQAALHIILRRKKQKEDLEKNLQTYIKTLKTLSPELQMQINYLQSYMTTAERFQLATSFLEAPNTSQPTLTNLPTINRLQQLALAAKMPNEISSNTSWSREINPVLFLHTFARMTMGLFATTLAAIPEIFLAITQNIATRQTDTNFAATTATTTTSAPLTSQPEQNNQARISTMSQPSQPTQMRRSASTPELSPRNLESPTLRRRSR